MNYALIDTSFFKGLVSLDKFERTEYELINTRLIDSRTKLIIPFPILYEITNSSLYEKNRHKKFIELWKDLIHQNRVIFEYDEEYRDTCLYNYLSNNKDIQYAKLSLVDRIIYEILLRKNNLIKYIVTGDNELANLCSSKFKTEPIMPATKRNRKN